jgi:hypothetical protein
MGAFIVLPGSSSLVRYCLLNGIEREPVLAGCPVPAPTAQGGQVPATATQGEEENCFQETVAVYNRLAFQCAVAHQPHTWLSCTSFCRQNWQKASIMAPFCAVGGVLSPQTSTTGRNLVLTARARTDYIPRDAGGQVPASPTQEGQVPASPDGTPAAGLPKHGFPVVFLMVLVSTLV